MAETEAAAYDVASAVADIARANGQEVSLEDLVTLGGALGLDDEEEEAGTYLNQPQPLSEESDEVDLADEERQLLARELAEKLGFFRKAASELHETWNEIENAYNLRPDGGSYRTRDGEQLVSPLLMMLVDQAEARLEGGILEAEPLVRVKPVQGIGPSQVQRFEESESTERFYNNYLRHELRIARRLVPALRRCPKLGTAVLRMDWKDEKRTHRFYSSGASLVEQIRQISRLDFDLVPNEETIVWPLDIVDWQDAEIVGHRAWYSPTGWSRKASALGISEERAKALFLRSSQPPPSRSAQTDRQGVDVSTLEDMEGRIGLTELWCHVVLPGRTEPDRFVVLLHEDTPEILRITWNTHLTQSHPYFPLRYKIVDGWAFGHGIGHEILANQVTASSLKTLELDNLAAGAYWFTQVRMGTLAHQVTDRIHPGMRVPVEEIDKDIKPTKMGGAAEEVSASAAKNDYEARAAVGLPDVLQGMGDARLKSGASTGQTLALIEQASVKFNSTGRTIRDDLGDFLRFGLELLAQYAPDGIMTRHADERDELVVRSMRWAPPRDRSIAEAFEVWVEAPSMATSNESRKERGLILSSFMGQQIQLLQPLVQQILGQENPAAMPRYLRSVHDFFAEMSRRMIRYHDMPGLEQIFPDLPEPIPIDQVVNQLQAQLQEMAGQMEALAQKNAVLEQSIQLGTHHQHPGGEMPS